MRKRELKSGMIVKTHNGIYYLVLLDTGMTTSAYTGKDILVPIDQNGNIAYDGWMDLSKYNDMLELENKDWNIIEVLSARRAGDIGKISRYKSVWRAIIQSN